AAVRELEEETGYNGGKISYLGSVSPNPAFHTNHCHTVVIQGVKPEGEQSLDPGEDLEVELMPLADIPGLIADGTVRHSLVMAAFQLLGLAVDASDE
ncbi:MAG: NUDIX hydrolase, partial [Candidatus Poseidoniia archaeon]|nr:NUDIX hydrolase [Candidatus Poseidoniia archaeon]